MKIKAIRAYSLQRKSLLAAAKIRGPNLLEHETLDIKGGAATILGNNQERTSFKERKHLENYYSLEILTKIKGSRPRIQALARFSAFLVIFLQF